MLGPLMRMIGTLKQNYCHYSEHENEITIACSRGLDLNAMSPPCNIIQEDLNMALNVQNQTLVFGCHFTQSPLQLQCVGEVTWDR